MDRSADPPAATSPRTGRGGGNLAGRGPRPTGFQKWGLAAALAAVLLSGLMAAALLVYQREHDLDEGRRLTEAFATIVDEQTTRALQALDQHLESIAQSVGPFDAPHSAAPDLLETQLRHLPFVQALFVLDGQGQLRYATAPAPAPGGYTTRHDGEDYFQIYRTRPGSGLVLGNPRRDGDRPQWILHASRPIQDDARQFAGVVVAVLQTDYFDASWRSLALESGSAIALMRTDGTMMLRSPLDDAAMRRSHAHSALFAQFLPSHASGSFRMASGVDGADRLTAYRTLAQQPGLVVVVGRTMDAVLVRWWQLARLVIGGWLLISITLIVAAVRLAHLSARRTGAEGDLNESREQFETLAQYSMQGIALVRKGQLAYINPALCTIVGRSADEITRLSPAQLMQWVHPDDRAESMLRQQDVLHGGPLGATRELRILHGDGQWRWVQSAMRSITLRGETALLAVVLDIHDRKLAEVALRSSEQLMRQMADSVGQMFWLMDMQHNRYLYISPAVHAVLGCAASDLQTNPRHWRRHIHPQDLARVEPLLDQARHTGSYDMQLRLLHPDGRLRWIHARAYPVHGPDQTPYRCAGVIEDITTRKLRENRDMRERDLLQYLGSDRPMHDVLEQFVLSYEAMVPDMLGSLLLLDADGVRLRHGAAPHLPKAYCDAIDGSAIGPSAGSCGTAAFTGATVVVADVSSDPRWLDYKDLALQHGLRACWSVPIKGVQGQVLGTFAYYFDRVRDATPDELVTIERGAQLASQAIERTLAVHALQDSETRYRNLVEWSPAGIIVHQQYRIVYSNPAGAAIFGARSVSQLMGHSVMSLTHPDERAPIQAAIDALALQGSSSTLAERRLLQLDGTVIYVEVKASAIMHEGAPAVQVVLRDISERKKAEAELVDSRQQLRVLSARVLAAQETERRRIAHELHDELGQALTAIKINLQAQDPLRHGKVSAPMAENIRIVDEALKQVRGLALALRPSMLDDLGLVPALRWLTEQTGSRNGIEMQLLAPSRLGRLAPDLETAVFRIVQEALTNVVRHAQARRVLVHIDAPGPDGMRVCISDDGVGFDVAAMRRRATAGNSMGLLGMQERAMLVGAELTLESAPGMGCTVSLRCPTQPAAAGAAGAPSGSAPV